MAEGLRASISGAARHPRLWRFMRGAMRRRFDAIAPRWDAIAGDIESPHFVAVRAGLRALPAGDGPRQVADIGTGTGALALGLAVRFPGAAVTGFDLAAAMLGRARHNLQAHAEAAAWRTWTRPAWTPASPCCARTGPPSPR